MGINEEVKLMKKNTIMTVIITGIVGVILLLSCMTKSLYNEVNTYYQVYLNGKQIGVINDKNELYNLINNNQSAIKNEYKVENVYPPTDLKIIATNTYSKRVDNVNTVYDKIEEDDDFTIKGYTVNVKKDNEEFKINILDKEVFYDAAKRFVSAFLSEEEYEKYINNSQEKIVATGRVIQGMRFLENITIQEAYVSVNEKIYTDELELSQFLLFGSNPKSKSYTVKLGDTIESVADDNELNVEEFLVANTNYKSSNTLLRVGDKVNVTLINPQLTFVYDLYEIKDEVVYYQKEDPIYDKNQPTTYKNVIPGRNGIDRVEEIYSVTNGERSQEVTVTKLATIKEVKNQITTIGTKKIPSNSGGGIINNYQPVVLDGYWAWPTNRGYVITSYRGWRWGRMHQGIDVSGAGNFGSPIYAAASGTVTYTYNGCPSRGHGYGDSCGNALGNSIQITHGNGYVTKYGHLHQTLKVKVGQTVKKGDLIGYMGNSGSSTGAHLHFEVLINGTNIDPMKLYQ